MFRKLLLTGIVLLSTCLISVAQNSSISGTITDSQTDEVVVGANVYIPSIERGTSTNIDGQFSIDNLAPGTYTLRVTFVGYKALNREVEAGETDLNIQLEPDLIGLDDIIVTAQQIERQSREIGTSIASVSGEEITKARDTNLLNSLSGKVSGVDIGSQSGTIGGSSRIVIRGNSTLTGNTQPLFVVDGVPVSNSNIVAGTASATRLSGGAVDVGNRASDINPDDIESISVLKGASAAALYGQRAQNGVILITTKRGSDQGGTKVTFNSSVRSNSPLRLPDFQNTFAQGSGGEYDNQDLNGWGPRIEGQDVDSEGEPIMDFRGEQVALQSNPNNVENFFQNGMETINSISIAGANEAGGDFRLGVTNTQSEGIIPESELQRTNLSLNAGQQFNDKLQARATVNYTFSETNGRAVQGGNSPNAIIQTIFSLPRTINTGLLRDNIIDENTGEQISLTDMTNNPFFITRNNGLDNDVERIFGSSNITYSPLDWLDVTGRVGIDFYTDNRSRPDVVGTLGRLTGGFSTDRIQERQIDANLLIGIDRQLSQDINFNATLGGNLNTRKTEIFSNVSTNLAVPGLYSFPSALSNSPTNDLSEQRLVALFFDATFGYQDYLYLNVTGRNDWSSTLPKENRSFFYPSANVSFIFTEALDFGGDILSYGKLRASIAEVGSDEAPYQLAFRYFPDNDAFGQFGTTLGFPFDGALAFDATNVIPPSNLKPQRQVSIEVGTELQFFDGRLGLDFTFYNNETRDQIISIPRPLSTGFDARRTNIGEVQNQGIEALFDVTPIRTRDFQWTSTFNFTKNNQTVEKLAPGVNELQINSGFNGLRVKAVPGEALGLYGIGWARNDNGDILIDEDTGLRVPGGEIRYGPQAPDYLLGINNSFDFKGFNLSFLIDIKQGGTVVSGTVQDLFFDGLAEETGALREQVGEDGEFIDDGGVIANGDGTFRENDVPVSSIEEYYQNLYQGSVFEEVAYDASYVKLREVKFGYTLPRRWLQHTPLSSASISVEGRNLWLIWAAAPHIDPETNVFGSGVIGQGVEFNNIPNVKSVGANIQLSF
ncbi:SusC/RagA family TonB-linked outer membrane protein [Fodinibius salsisoli]|uniref:SusC/RagA family TonB-linked outer membrane protein n=1 Tax=Fodinibius salsisoli TaxID=2820877 RepID=A0ABT3PJ41_9BACT|nr:SusC/RagA family TonB-linked outer membrane protein [Fodinibius salsisoli]MCW9705947.1 SusC/RagA family TonB-linked outer membrane protein [Fodinibius salsisoli]